MVRRVVTAIASGRSVVSHDGELPVVAYQHTPGFAQAVVWTTGSSPASAAGGPPTSLVPGPGETVALTITFPPDSVFSGEAFDPAAAAGENLRNSPGLAELFEPDAPGMHRTPTVDYAVVLEGSLVLELDDGARTLLGPGDIVVQNGTRHAWRVPFDKPATVFVVLVGRAGEPE